MVILNTKKIDLLTIEEIEVISELAETWYGTPGHCLLYPHNPSAYMAIWRNKPANNRIIAACFFSYINHYLSGNCLQINGGTPLTYLQLKELLKATKQKILILPVSEESTKGYQLPWWKLQLLRTESDWILNLPESIDEYLKVLGKTTRKHLKNYIQKLESSFQSEIKILTGTEISMGLFTELYELHKKRWKKNGKEITIQEDDIIRRFELARSNGIIFTRWKEGRIISGTLNYLHQSDAYLSLIAHDPEFDEYHLGLITVFDTLKYFIEKKFRNYNLHFRHSPFKTRLGAKEHPYFNLFVFDNFLTAKIWNLKRLVTNLTHKIKLHIRT